VTICDALQALDDAIDDLEAYAREPQGHYLRHEENLTALMEVANEAMGVLNTQFRKVDTHLEDSRDILGAIRLGR
jgi:hypothetical protein